MNTCQRKLLAMCTLLLLFAPAGPAQAWQAYALASNNIRDFRLDAGAVRMPAIFLSTTTATLNGKVDSSGFGLGILDGQISQLGSTLANNVWLAGGANTNTGRTAQMYSYADALISHAPGGDHPFQTQALAESNLPRDGYASGTVRNSATIVFTAAGGAALDISFTANPWIKTFRDDQLGLSAAGALKTTIEITCSSDFCGMTPTNELIRKNDVVFSWAPDGLLADKGTPIGGALGGKELSDAENLNSIISNLLNVNGPGELNYSDNNPAFGLFQATTGILAGGLYKLELTVHATESIASIASAVPEPGHWSMIVLGLSVLFLYRARREDGTARP